MIAVDRSGGARAMRGLMRDAARAVAERRQIVIFPEGTRAEPGAVLPLQPGIAALAASTGLPVIPVVTDSGRCWGRRAFRKYPGVIHIVLLPPIPCGTAAPGTAAAAGGSLAHRRADRGGCLWTSLWADSAAGSEMVAGCASNILI